MRFQVVIIALFIATVCLFKNAQAIGAGPVGPPSFCPIHLSIISSEAAKVNTPDLPEDLKLRLANVVDNATEICASCEGLVIWQSKVCVVSNLKSGLLQIQQIKAEADARIATTAASVQ